MGAEREHLQREAGAVEGVEEREVVVGTGRAGGQQQDGTPGIETEGAAQECAALLLAHGGTEEVGSQHEASEQGVLRRHAERAGVGAGRLGGPDPLIARRVHPVAAEAVAPVELRATGAGAHPSRAQHLAGEFEKAPVQVRVHAQHPVRPVLLELLDAGPHPQELPPPTVQRRVLEEREVQVVRARPVRLHEVIEMESDPVVRAGCLQGREALHLHPDLGVPARPLRKGGGPRIVAATGARGQDQKAHRRVSLASIPLVQGASGTDFPQVFLPSLGRAGKSRSLCHQSNPRRTFHPNHACSLIDRSTRWPPRSDACEESAGSDLQIMAVPPLATTVSPTM